MDEELMADARMVDTVGVLLHHAATVAVMLGLAILGPGLTGCAVVTEADELGQVKRVCIDLPRVDSITQVGDSEE